MKKQLLVTLALLSTSLCFAVSNITLYEEGQFAYRIIDNKMYNADGELIFKIKDNSLYDTDDEYAEETITESDETILIGQYIFGELLFSKEYSKTTGFLLTWKSYWYWDSSSSVSEYDEKTGLVKSYSYYLDGELDFYELFEHEQGKLTKTLHYNADGSLSGYMLYSYDKNTGMQISETYLDSNGTVVGKREYDISTGNRTNEYKYNADGTINWKTTFDKETDKPIERLVYTQPTKKAVRWTFLQFNEDGTYELGDGFYLNKDFCLYETPRRNGRRFNNRACRLE